MTPEQLLTIRKRGQRPDGPVCLSLVGRIAKLDVPVIEWRHGADLRGLRDLWVIVAAANTQNHMIDVIDRVVRLAPDVEWWDVLTGKWTCIRDAGRDCIYWTPPLWN